jgi:cysteine desulfurase
MNIKRTTYLDCNATTPTIPAVINNIRHYMTLEFGNAGSRTHAYGTMAQQAVQNARKHIANVVNCQPEEVVFTSGATESNNLAILGLAGYGESTGRKHIITTSIEHKAVLDPVWELQRRGFEVSLVGCDGSGRICPEAVAAALREDTLLVSVMHANNETGILQPIAKIAAILADHPAYFHVDAAQGFGKDIETLRNPRIDLISISGHKIYGPKGVGALVTRRRKFKRPPLRPLVFGGGQERGLRPGTLPVPLIAGLGKAAELAEKDCEPRKVQCQQIRTKLLKIVANLGGIVNGDPQFCMPHVLNFSIPGVNSEAAMLALKGIVAISNGSACTSSSYEPSHVLTAMGLSEDRIEGAMRFSWCHMTEEPDWNAIMDALKLLT